MVIYTSTQEVLACPYYYRYDAAGITDSAQSGICYSSVYLHALLAMLSLISIKLKSTIKLISVWLAIIVPLFLASDYLVTRFYFQHIVEQTKDMEKAYRVPHPVYHHDLRKNYQGRLLWGSSRLYNVYTNSLGMKDGLIREVNYQKSRTKKRLLFIGDSFTEGVGLEWQQTFVGKFSPAMPNLEVLNAGVSSYSPSVYYTKLKYWLANGLELDEVILFIDISDIQDEVSYRENKRGELECTESEAVVNTLPLSVKLSVMLEQNFRLTYNLLRLPVHLFKKKSDIIDLPRAAWTLESAKNRKQIIRAYEPIGIDGAIAKAKEQMTRLHDLLSSKGISLSVAVYPWPTQLYYDDEESKQVIIWQEWCEGKCKHYINLFPDFFRIKRLRPDWYKYLFLDGDVHFNEQGHEIIAKKLLHLTWD